MKKQIIVIGLQLFLAAMLYSQEYMSGELLDKDGIATKITDIRADGYVKGTYKGKSITIEFPKLKRIDVLGKSGQLLWSLRVTNVNGETFQLERAWMHTPDAKDDHGGAYKQIKLYYYDPISMEKKSDIIYTDHVKQLVFLSELGRLRFNERTNEFFPPDYVFDPFTGEQLKWKNPAY